MKDIQKLLWILAIFTLLTACEKETREPVAVTGNAPGVMQPSAGTQIVLQRQQAGEEAISFSWSEADFGFPSATTYTLQIDVAGNNFSAPQEVAVTTELSVGLTHEALNQRIMALGFTTSDPVDLEFRVIASVSPFFSTLPSEPLALTVTPYASSFPPIYMIGAVFGGWDLAMAVELISTGEPAEYITIAYFDPAPGTNFRFFNNPEWDASIGGYDVFTEFPQDLLEPATNDQDPNFNFLGEAGWYQLIVNRETGTISMESTDEPGMYVTGDATHGWDWDEPVTQLQYIAYNIWEGNVEFIQNNAFRLFAQKDWGPVSYGYDVVVNYNTEYIDVMEGHGDPNWQFLKPSGTYFVRVNLRDNSIEIQE